MNNTQFGENTLYVQRMFSCAEGNEGVRNFGILADRVRKAGRSKVFEDGLHVNGWRAGVAADGPNHPNSIKYKPTKSQIKREKFAKFLNKSHNKDLYGANELTRTPTNHKHMEQWARDYALSKFRPYVKDERQMFKPEYKKFRDAYHELMAGVDTQNVRDIMDEARRRVKDIEAKRQDTWSYPHSLIGEENKYEYDNRHK